MLDDDIPRGAPDPTRPRATAIPLVAGLMAPYVATWGSVAPSLEQALGQTDGALRAIGAGNPDPYVALWDHGPDVTPFGAWGPIERGFAALRKTVEWVAVASAAARRCPRTPSSR